MRDISAELGWKLPKSCSRRRGSSYTLMVERGNGEGFGVGEVRALRMPSVVSRVRRYGEVKNWRVSVGWRRERSLTPASVALNT